MNVPVLGSARPDFDVLMEKTAHGIAMQGNTTGPKIADGAQQPELKPLYVQIKKTLIERIVKGEWGPGELLPSEMKLASQFQVHQGTVRKALDDLALQHLVVRQQGRGTFVAAATMRHKPFHFLRVRAKSGANETPTTEFLSCVRTRATLEERRNLHLIDPEVVRLVKLRRFERKPIILERIAIRGDLFPGLENLLNDLHPETTYPLLEQRFRVLIVQVVEKLSAVSASAQDAKLLGLRKGSALLQIDRIAYSLAGSAIEWRVSRCNTSAYEYVVELT